MRPSVVSASKSGAVSPIVSAMSETAFLGSGFAGPYKTYSPR